MNNTAIKTKVRTVPVVFCKCQHIDFAHGDKGKGACEGWLSAFDDACIRGCPTGRPCDCTKFEAAR